MLPYSSITEGIASEYPRANNRRKRGTVWVDCPQDPYDLNYSRVLADSPLPTLLARLTTDQAGGGTRRAQYRQVERNTGRRRIHNQIWRTQYRTQHHEIHVASLLCPPPGYCSTSRTNQNPLATLHLDTSYFSQGEEGQITKTVLLSRFKYYQDVNRQYFEETLITGRKL